MEWPEIEARAPEVLAGVETAGTTGAAGDLKTARVVRYRGPALPKSRRLT